MKHFINSMNEIQCGRRYEVGAGMPINSGSEPKDNFDSERGYCL